MQLSLGQVPVDSTGVLLRPPERRWADYLMPQAAAAAGIPAARAGATLSNAAYIQARGARVRRPGSRRSATYSHLGSSARFHVRAHSSHTQHHGL